MKHATLDMLRAFAAVADERSFTRAAARLGVSPSALSHGMRGLESHLGVRLLDRTTRSVAPTEAGQRLLETLQPALDSIAVGIDALSRHRDRPAGSLRITATHHAYTSLLRPLLPRFIGDHPDIDLELALDDGFTDIVGARFDAGIRLGELLEKDMVALCIGPDVQPALVASPEYLACHGTPATPRDLRGHRCIGYRRRASGALYSWPFSHRGIRLDVRPAGGPVFHDDRATLDAALAGIGIAWLFLDQLEGLIEAGRLVRLLPEWIAPVSGYHLYYSDRRQKRPALAAFIDMLKCAT